MLLLLLAGGSAEERVCQLTRNEVCLWGVEAVLYTSRKGRSSIAEVHTDWGTFVLFYALWFPLSWNLMLDYPSVYGKRLKQNKRLKHIFSPLKTLKTQSANKGSDSFYNEHREPLKQLLSGSISWKKRLFVGGSLGYWWLFLVGKHHVKTCSSSETRIMIKDAKSALCSHLSRL